MKARFPLSIKIGLFAAMLVVGACVSVWFWAVFNPAMREKENRVAQYHQLVTTLGLSGAVNAAALTHSAMHPDLVFVIRSRGGELLLDGSTAHVDRLQRHDPDLAQKWSKDKRAVLEELSRLDTNLELGLVVKRLHVGPDSIELGFSTIVHDQELRARLISSAIVLAICLAAAILGAIILAKKIARPVRELSIAMDEIGRGHYQILSVTSRDEVGLLTLAFNDMVRGLKERSKLEDTLARYVSDDVASRILAERSALDLKGELREVTVLFLNFRRFSAAVNGMAASEAMSMLNEYLAIAIEVVRKHHGTVHKFVGSSVLAIFGAPFSVDDAPMRSVRAAVEIDQRVASLNQRRKEAKKPIVLAGMGINTGAAIAGNIGTEKRMEYAVFGDDVELAQRVEALAQEGCILISQSTYDSVRARVEARPLEAIQLRGRAVHLWTFEVLGLGGPKH